MIGDPPQHPPHLPSSRSFTNLRLSSNSFSSLAFSFDFLRPLCPTPLSFSVSVPFFLSLLSLSRFHIHAGVFDSLLRAPPFSVAVRTGRAAPLAARKKGGPKRTSYFLCSDSNLGGPKWPPMM